MEEKPIRLTREEYHKQVRHIKKKRLRPWTFYLFTTIFLVGIIISSIQLYNWNNDNKKIDKLSKEIEEITDITPIKDEEELINPPEVTDEKMTIGTS